MKLGEALTVRSQLLARIAQIRERLKAKALVQEGVGSRDPTRSITVDAPALYNLGTMTMVTFRGRSATTREGRVRTALSPK